MTTLPAALKKRLQQTLGGFVGPGFVPGLSLQACIKALPHTDQISAGPSSNSLRKHHCISGSPRSHPEL